MKYNTNHLKRLTKDKGSSIPISGEGSSGTVEVKQEEKKIPEANPSGTFLCSVCKDTKIVRFQTLDKTIVEKPCFNCSDETSPST